MGLILLGRGERTDTGYKEVLSINKSKCKRYFKMIKKDILNPTHHNSAIGSPPVVILPGTIHKDWDQLQYSKLDYGLFRSTCMIYRLFIIGWFNHNTVFDPCSLILFIYY